MRTVQMTLDPDLIEEVDRAAAAQGKNRSAFTRDALRAALAVARERELEEQHRLAYQRQPWRAGEIEEDWDDWEPEQVWPK
jgi:metal-responsive CopG/Arc/MetJ family transcriptional regulator